MNQKVKFILCCVCFVGFIAIAVLGYNYLSSNYKTDELNGIVQNSGEYEIEDTSGEYEENNSHEMKDESEINENVFPAIDFEVLDRNGNVVKLSDFYGKPIVINFWATWCGPCQAELPDFEEVYNQYGEEIEFLMVNLTDGYTDTVSSVEKFVSEKQYEFPVYFDTEYSASDAYEVYSIPQTVFIDRNANIVASYIGMINKNILETNIDLTVEK